MLQVLPAVCLHDILLTNFTCCTFLFLQDEIVGGEEDFIKYPDTHEHADQCLQGLFHHSSRASALRAEEDGVVETKSS